MQRSPLFRRSQSRWIATQIQQYRSIERTPETWRVLFAAFQTQFSNGGVDGQAITLEQYKGHYRYLARRAKQNSMRYVENQYEPEIKMEPVAPPPRPRLLRTRATAAAIAAEAKRYSHKSREVSDDDSLQRRGVRCSERRSSKRLRYEDEDVAIKQEGVSEVERLANELRECQASLKRMKHSAHAWKVKYKELLAAMPAAPSPPSNSNHHTFTVKMNINVDVSQNGKRTNRHTVRVTEVAKPTVSA